MHNSAGGYHARSEQAEKRRLTARFPSDPELDGPVVAASGFGVVFRHVCREN